MGYLQLRGAVLFYSWPGICYCRPLWYRWPLEKPQRAPGHLRGQTTWSDDWLVTGCIFTRLVIFCLLLLVLTPNNRLWHDLLCCHVSAVILFSCTFETYLLVGSLVGFFRSLVFAWIEKREHGAVVLSLIIPNLYDERFLWAVVEPNWGILVHKIFGGHRRTPPEAQTYTIASFSVHGMFNGWTLKDQIPKLLHTKIISKTILLLMKTFYANVKVLLWRCAKCLLFASNTPDELFWTNVDVPLNWTTFGGLSVICSAASELHKQTIHQVIPLVMISKLVYLANKSWYC